MVKEIKSTGLSRDLIIHPGETLAEVLEDRGMSQRELAVRTGMTEKHISKVIHGYNNISSAFARKLEYALGIETAFWMNLQANYDRELLEFEELNSISEQELEIVKELKDVSQVFVSFGWLEADAGPIALVLDYRKIFGISNLSDIKKFSYSGAFRMQNNNTFDPYILFAWQRMCELLTKDIETADEVDIEELRKSVEDIKKVMFSKSDVIQRRLTEIFSSCGIAFKIVPSFKGAPVQGFIKKTDGGRLMLCMTLRQKFADIFWFTLFHEIAHVLNGDTKNIFIDFDSMPEKIERKADKMAGDFLLDPKAYEQFVKERRYLSGEGMRDFAASQNVQEYIVNGRLMKDGIIPWGARQKYEWV